MLYTNLDYFNLKLCNGGNVIVNLYVKLKVYEMILIREM